MIWVLFLILALFLKKSVELTVGGREIVIENPLLRALTGAGILIFVGALFFGVGLLLHWIGKFILLPFTLLF